MTRKRKRKCTRPRDRITQASCLLITALLIVSAVSAGVGTGTASAEPAGMVSVPDQNITEDIPADASTPLGASQLHDGRILTDTHAMSLDVILTTPARAGEITGTDTASFTGDMALILRDTEHSAGRRVAIDSGLLQTALGYEPQAIYGTHESGEQWTAPAEYVDGYLVFEVPHFSTNTVTFSGAVEINATGVTTGTKFSYNVPESYSISEERLIFTGETTTQQQSANYRVVGDETHQLSIGGNTVTSVNLSLANANGVAIKKESYSTSSQIDDIEVMSGVAYGISQNSVFAVNVDNGNLLWDKQMAASGNQIADIEVDNNNNQLYVASAYKDSTQMYVLDANNGDTLDSINSLPTTQITALSLSQGTVFAGSSDGEVFAIDASDLSTEWNTDIAATKIESLSASQNSVFALSSSRSSFALDTSQSGNIDWSHNNTSNSAENYLEVTSGSTTLNVSNQDYLKAYLAGADGQKGDGYYDQTQGSFYGESGSPGATGLARLDISNVDQITIYGANGRSGYQDGSSGESISSDPYTSGGDGGGSSAIVASDGTVLASAGGGDGGESGHGEAGGSGGGPGGFNVNSGVALSGGSGPSSGVAIKSIGQFSTNPNKLAYEPQRDSVAVVDSGSTTRLSAAHGNVLSSQNNNPATLTVNADTGKLVFGSANSLIREITQTGAYNWEYQASQDIESISIGANGDVAVAGIGNNLEILKINPPVTSGSISFAGQTTSINQEIQSGDEISKTISNVQPGDYSVSASATPGALQISMDWKAKTKTVDPSVIISSGPYSQTVSYTGRIDDGSSVDVSDQIDTSMIGGDTQLLVQMPDDTATPSVEIDYSHRSLDNIQTNYSAGTFEERYNVSHTYAKSPTDSQVTIPFASERVVGVKLFEYRIDGGEWKAIPDSDRRFENTTATAYLSQLNAGISAGTTIGVRAVGRKINVDNGEVKITDTTKPGEPLDTQLKIQSRSDGFSIDVGPTANGRRVHYAYSNKYPTKDYVVISADGSQKLYLPESQTGDTFRMKHVRTKANVVAGDAKIRVVDPDDKKFEIMPGPGGDGDTVELTYYGTKPGNTYLLESLTREIILDTETANSPVTFVDDDSHEMWRILLESGGSGDTGGGGGLIGVASGAASNAGSAVSGLLPAISVPALGGIGGVGSAGFALALAGAVAVLVYGNVFGRIAGVIASLNPFGGTPASGGGADTGNGGIDTSGVTSALSGVVTRAGRVGGTAGVRVLRATTQLLTTSTRIIGRESARLARYLAANPSVALGLGGVGVAVAAYQGLVQLTPQATTAILIGSGGLITYLVLQRTGTFSWLSFGLIFGAFVILGAGAINPDVLASFGASLQDILPLLVIVGAYVVYRILQTRSQDASTPDTIVRFTGGGNGSDDNNN